MAHHLQCKLPGEAWATLATSEAKDRDDARSYLADMKFRYQGFGVLDPTTQFRIVSDESLQRPADLAALTPTGPVAQAR